MSSALADCEQLLETAVTASGGRVVKREGDAVMAVFEDPSAAVTAAASAQSELAQRRWPGIGELRVRMGLHVGAAEHRDGDYYGSTVIRAARLCACAHGGQVVASSAVSMLAPTASWLDLGEYRLRGLREPERIHQLVIGDGRRFPPLREVEPTIDRLPRPRTSFVGRAGRSGRGRRTSRFTANRDVDGRRWKRQDAPRDRDRACEPRSLLGRCSVCRPRTRRSCR